MIGHILTIGRPILSFQSSLRYSPPSLLSFQELAKLTVELGEMQVPPEGGDDEEEEEEVESSRTSAGPRGPGPLPLPPPRPGAPTARPSDLFGVPPLVARAGAAAAAEANVLCKLSRLIYTSFEVRARVSRATQGTGGCWLP